MPSSSSSSSSSWPQPAVLTNILASSTTTAVTDKDEDDNNNNNYRVLALYKFVKSDIPTSSLPDLKSELMTACRQYSARGTLLIAEEGINGTLCYPFNNKKSTSSTTTIINDDGKNTDKTTTIVKTAKEKNDTNTNDDDDNNIDDNDNKKKEKNNDTDDNDDDDDELLSFLQNKFDHSLRIRISNAVQPVFSRLKIRIKSEIVTMQWEGDAKCSINNDNNNNINNDDNTSSTTSTSTSSTTTAYQQQQSSCGPCCPTKQVGEYVSPREWNKLLLDPDTIVIDTRNEYEIDVGTFKNSINPHTQSFVEFPNWIQKNIVGDNDNDDNDDVNDDGSKDKKIPLPVEKKKIAMFCKLIKNQFGSYALESNYTSVSFQFLCHFLYLFSTNFYHNKLSCFN
jgi:predicted sulfurtransferase